MNKARYITVEGKKFKTKRAYQKYVSWEPIIADIKKRKPVGYRKSLLFIRKAQKSWIGK